MDKAQLLNTMRLEKRTADVALAYSYIVATGCWHDYFRNLLGAGTMTIGDGRNDTVLMLPNSKDFPDLYGSNDTVAADGLNLIRVGLRNAVIQSFEGLKNYCEASGDTETAKWRNVSWYQFARLLRNSFSHDFRWNFRKHRSTEKLRPDLKVIFSDQAVRFPNSLHGQEINFSTLSVKHVFELLNWMDAFADKELS